MKDLTGVKVFLSGPIDRVADDGVGWRREFIKKSKKAKLPLIFLDPTNKPKDMGSEVADEKIRIKGLMKRGKWKQAQEEVKQFRRFDLRMVDHCHLYVMYMDVTVHFCGTYDECYTAERQQKPLFVIMAPGQSKYDIPSWLVALLDEDEVFESVDECIEHLMLLHKGKILLDNRWVMV